MTRTQTLGWKAGCGCGAEPVPCTVMDIFNGAGTTGLVAVRLGREYVGIELNPKYVEMAEKRLRNDRPLFTPPLPRGEPAEQMEMPCPN